MNALLHVTIGMGVLSGLLSAPPPSQFANPSRIVAANHGQPGAGMQHPALSMGQTLPDWVAQQSSSQASAQRVYEQGVQLHGSGDLNAAVQRYRQAIRLNPKLDAAYINLGLALIELKQLDNAKQVLQQVLRLPDRRETPASIHTLAHYNLAVILNRQGQRKPAIAEVQKALVITPNFAIAQELLQQLKNVATK